MSPTLDIADARIAVVDPDTPAVILQDIAAHHPTLWALVAAHPNTSPQVLAWLQRVGDEAVLNALATRESAMPFDEFMEVTEPIDEPTTYQEPAPTYAPPPPVFTPPPAASRPPQPPAPPMVPQAQMVRPPMPMPMPMQAPMPTPIAPPAGPPPLYSPDPQQFIPAPSPFIPDLQQFIPAPQSPFIVQEPAPPVISPEELTLPLDIASAGLGEQAPTPPVHRGKRFSEQPVSRWYTTDLTEKRQSNASRNRMIVLVVALVVAILVGSGWLVYHGTASNQNPSATTAQQTSQTTDSASPAVAKPHVSDTWVSDVTDTSFNINVSVTNPSGIPYSVCIYNAGKQLACWDQMTATYRQFTTPVDGDYRSYPMDPTVKLAYQ